MKDALIELEPVLTELHATTGIIQHLASTAAEVAEVEWSKLAGDLYRCSEKIDELWDRARDERHATDAAHKAALAAVRAEKEAPGSKADVERAAALWALLSGLTEVAIRQCTNAGFPPRHEPQKEDAPIGFADSTS
jgi:hypothetical protein